MTSTGAHVYTIAPTAPFLPTLADAIFNGHIFQQWSRRGTFSLSDMVIYLPTKRAARALEDLLLEKSGTSSLLLPSIRPLGQVDEDKLSISQDPGLEELKEAISPLERTFILARLIEQWIIATGQRGGSTPAGAQSVEDLNSHTQLPPPGMGDYITLAEDLGQLIDTFHIEGLSWSRLTDLVPEDYAEYWQMSLSFLKIASEAWPAILQERGQIDAIARRQALIELEATNLQKHPPDTPVLVAGSTGSIQSTAKLLKAVAYLPNGAVVLPGLDRFMDNAIWQEINGKDDPHMVHPQTSMKRLLHVIGINRSDVVDLVPPKSLKTCMNPLRLPLISGLMCPAVATNSWVKMQKEWSTHDEDTLDPFTGLTLIEAPHEQDEALSIALILREVMQEDGKKAALVTPNRDIARQVSQLLRKWDIRVDDSSGKPLAQSSPGVFMRLILDAIVKDFSPVELLALLKHPLMRMGQSPQDMRKLARQMEVVLLRGPRIPDGLEGLLAALHHMRDEARHEKDRATTNSNSKQHRMVRGFKRSVTHSLQTLETLIDGINQFMIHFSPLITLYKSHTHQKIALETLFSAHIQVAENISRSEDNNILLYDHEAGKTLQNFKAQLIEVLANTNTLAPQCTLDDYYSVFHTLIRNQVVHEPFANNQRIAIWGTLEARLQSPDCLILAGLNEDSWPGQPKVDSWMSNSMRHAMELLPLEKSIGLEAHDFEQSLGVSEIYLTRAERLKGTPSIPSRWIQRLYAFAGQEKLGSLKARGQKYLDWAKQINQPDEKLIYQRPEPKPPVAHRPTKFAVTRIEKLIRDPYEIFARDILKLYPLDDFGIQPDALQRGNLFHEILADFISNWNEKFDDKAYEQLIEIGRQAFKAIIPFPEVYAFWWQQFEQTARGFIDFEAKRDGLIIKRYAEIEGRTTLELPKQKRSITLTAKADRIDVMHDGSTAILDYKTGATPSKAQVQQLWSPQLPLEALIFLKGGFKDIKVEGTINNVSQLSYISLGSSKPFVKVTTFDLSDEKNGDLIARTEAQLIELLTQYEDENRGYPAQKHPAFKATRFESDYAYVERTAEWAMSDSEDE